MLFLKIFSLDLFSKNASQSTIEIIKNIQEILVQNQGLHDATVQALTDRGCPTDLAKSAATVVANDDATKPDLGRTKEDQKVIQEALPYLQNQ